MFTDFSGDLLSFSLIESLKCRFLLDFSPSNVLGDIIDTGKHTKNDEDPPFSSWVNPPFRLGHFLCRFLYVYLRVINLYPMISPIKSHKFDEAIENVS